MLQPNPQDQCVDFIIKTTNESVIKSAILTAEHLFEGESSISYEYEATPEILLQLKPEKDIGTEMQLQVLVGHPMGLPFFNLFIF